MDSPFADVATAFVGFATGEEPSVAVEARKTDIFLLTFAVPLGRFSTVEPRSSVIAG